MKKFFLIATVLFVFLVSFCLVRIVQVVKPFESLKLPYSSPQPLESPKPDNASSVKLSFAVIGDVESDLINLKKALELVKQKNLEFAVVVGDLTKTGTSKELDEVKKVLDKSEITYYVIPGNHDLWYLREEGIDTFSQYFSQRFYAREIKGLSLVFLDTADEWLGISEEQQNWLGHFLFNNKDFISGKLDNKYFVFNHIPFWHPESKKAMGEYSETLKDQAYLILQEFCKHPPLAVFSGHLHKVQEYNYGCGNGKMIRMINAGSINEARNWQLPRFLKADIYDDGELEINEIEL